MWYLTSQTDIRILYVVPSREAVIGRSLDGQQCNFAITDDASISRKHAILRIMDNSLYVEDLGSRYGTFINDITKLEPNTNVKLNLNDHVKLGKINSIWKVNEILFVTCTSTLKGENLQNLKLRLGELGAVLKNDWDDSCGHLTMPALTLTIKVVLALSQGAYIVTTEFWNKCLDAVRNHTNLPDPKNYTPQVVESTLNKENVSFLPNPARMNLFAGKTFIFFSRRQLDLYKSVLNKCSATALLLSETKMTKSTLCEPSIIVIQYILSNSSQETQVQRNQINEIVNFMKSKGKRVIADAEIGLAILYCSTAKYCNPDFNFSTEVVKQAPNSKLKSANVLAQESQEPSAQIKRENVVINESLNSTCSKRKLTTEDDEGMNASKKIATSSDNESVKRKLSEDNGMNPSKKMAVENDEEIFNFMDNAADKGKENKTTENKLNFAKPSQKKQDVATNNEDDLFNFVDDKPKNDSGNISKNIIFDSNKSNSNHQSEPESFKHVKKTLKEEIIDIEAMRGSKLQELTENINYMSFNIKVKKEESVELDSKMNGLDLGETIIIIRKDLIVKKEPVSIVSEGDSIHQRNFKKFKKVWPLKMQVSIIPK